MSIAVHPDENHSFPLYSENCLTPEQEKALEDLAVELSKRLAETLDEIIEKNQVEKVLKDSTKE